MNWFSPEGPGIYLKSAAKVGMFCELTDRKNMAIFQKKLYSTFTHINVDKL